MDCEKIFEKNSIKIQPNNTINNGKQQQFGKRIRWKGEQDGKERIWMAKLVFNKNIKIKRSLLVFENV